MKTLEQHQNELNETWGEDEKLLGSNESLKNQISHFGFGELEFHTADISRLIYDVEALQSQLKAEREDKEQKYILWMAKNKELKKQLKEEREEKERLKNQLELLTATR